MEWGCDTILKLLHSCVGATVFNQELGDYPSQFPHVVPTTLKVPRTPSLRAALWYWDTDRYLCQGKAIPMDNPLHLPRTNQLALKNCCISSI